MKLRLLLLLATLALGALMLHYVNVTYDDAFISFRYAENAARGHGLVFNPGERVEGYSNFLWTLLLVPFEALGVARWEFGMLWTAKALGALFGCATILVVTRTAERTLPAPRWAAALPALFLATCAPFSFWSVGALETSLVALSIAAAVHFDLEALEEPTPRPGCAAALFWLLASLTRPEPPLYFVAAWALVYAVQSRRFGFRKASGPALRKAALFTLPALAFVALRFDYYGELLPNTYYAKMHLDPRLFARGFDYLSWGIAVLGLPLGFAVASLGLVLSANKVRVLYLSSLVLVMWAVVWREGGDWLPGLRLFVPALPLVALVFFEAFVAFGRIPKGARFGQAALVLALALGAWQSRRAINVLRIESGFSRIHFDEGSAFEQARWMAKNLEPQSLLAVGDAGVIPYYTRLPVLDLYGLMDKHLARQPGRLHTKFDLPYVLSREPRYVHLSAERDASGAIVSGHTYARALLASPEFERDYSVIKEFPDALIWERRSLIGRQAPATTQSPTEH